MTLGLDARLGREWMLPYFNTRSSTSMPEESYDSAGGECVVLHESVESTDVKICAAEAFHKVSMCISPWHFDGYHRYRS